MGSEVALTFSTGIKNEEKNDDHQTCNCKIISVTMAKRHTGLRKQKFSFKFWMKNILIKLDIWVVHLNFNFSAANFYATFHINGKLAKKIKYY